MGWTKRWVGLLVIQMAVGIWASQAQVIQTRPVYLNQDIEVLDRAHLSFLISVSRQHLAIPHRQQTFLGSWSVITPKGQSLEVRLADTLCLIDFLESIDLGRYRVENMRVYVQITQTADGAEQIFGPAFLILKALDLETPVGDRIFNFVYRQRGRSLARMHMQQQCALAEPESGTYVAR